MVKINKLENKENCEKTYFGKTEKESLKEYKYIYSMEKLFDEDVLRVQLFNRSEAYVDNNLNIILGFEEIVNFGDYYIIKKDGEEFKVEK